MTREPIRCQGEGQHSKRRHTKYVFHLQQCLKLDIVHWVPFEMRYYGSMEMNRPANKQLYYSFKFKYSQRKEAVDVIKLYFVAMANGEGLYELDHSCMFSLLLLRSKFECCLDSSRGFSLSFSTYITKLRHFLKILSRFYSFFFSWQCLMIASQGASNSE